MSYAPIVQTQKKKRKKVGPAAAFAILNYLFMGSTGKKMSREPVPTTTLSLEKEKMCRSSMVIPCI
jgi:hypothetical protein